MITSDSGSDEAVVEDRHAPAGRVQLVSPSRAVAQVDHDRFVLDALLGERDAYARAVRAARRRRSASCLEPHQPRRSARRAPARAAAPRAWPRCERLAARRRVSAPVRRDTSVGLAASASSSPFGSSPYQVGTDRYSSTIRPRSKSRKRTTSPSSASATVTAPSRSESSRAKRPCASRSRSKHRVGDADPAAVRRRTSGCSSRGRNWATARSTLRPRRRSARASIARDSPVVRARRAAWRAPRAASP